MGWLGVLWAGWEVCVSWLEGVRWSVGSNSRVVCGGQVKGPGLGARGER